jgi:hypothetical protein
MTPGQREAFWRVCQATADRTEPAPADKAVVDALPVDLIELLAAGPEDV